MDRRSGVRLYLVRHGEAANVRDGVFRYNGHIDVDVSPKGMRQIERVAEYLKDKKVSAVYSSDLLRARRGAEAIARHHGLTVEAFLEFREIKMGVWEGLTFGEIQERYPGEVESKFKDFINYRVLGGENVIDVKNRAIPKLRELIALNRGGQIVLVGHGGMNMILLCDAMNLGFDNFFRIIQGNGCLNIIDYFDDIAVVRLINGFTEGAVLSNT
ncbi:MAG: alpha-ribazole phosphatase [Proteobacteria bacterium]|nr:alpha-ribazole phosphatase [Pseudomonadota bacterium]